MKQKLLTTFLLLAAVLLGHAQVVTQQQAQQKAMSFMQEQDMPVRKGITAAPLSFTKTGKAPFYVFNTTEGKGFVIVSADERTEEILGYSMDSQFEESRLSETMRIWLREYANQIEALPSPCMWEPTTPLANWSPPPGDRATTPRPAMLSTSSAPPSMAITVSQVVAPPPWLR